MTQRPSRDWRGIGCATIVAASIAFPMGFIVGSDKPPAEDPVPSGSGTPFSIEPPTARNVYSPRVGSDPYVIAQQRKVVQGLEISCRQFKRHCVEAAQARLRVEEAEAR